MKLIRQLSALSVALTLGAVQQVCIAAQGQDSVYKWGRWAVLSPAAGGPPPYVPALTPDAVNNARPEEAIEFSPQVLGLEAPGVVPNPPGEPPPSGDPRSNPPPVIPTPIVAPNPPGAPPPTGDPRNNPPSPVPPVVVPNPPATPPPSGSPRG